MHFNEERLGPGGLAAFGPYVEERKGSEELLRNRPAKEGHELYLAHDTRNGALVLLHRLTIDTEASEEARQSVLAAARLAMKFQHRAALTLSEVLALDSGLIYAQQFPGGVLLGDSIEHHGPLPPRAALKFMHSLAEAMGWAQKMQLTLSQISPQDILLGDPSGGDALPQIFSFCPPVPMGWWLEVDDPAFASPEQKMGRICDVRSALYSAGASLAFMLTGRRRTEKEAWKPWVEKLKLPKQVKAALLAVLQEDPAQRSATPAAWREALAVALQAVSPVVRVQQAAPKPPAPLRPAAKPRPNAGKKIPARSFGGLWITAALSAFVACLIFVVWTTRPMQTIPYVARAPHEVIETVPLASKIAPPIATNNIRPPPIPKPPRSPPTLPIISPPPPPPPLVSETVRRAQPASAVEVLLDEASHTPPPRQMELLRQVLAAEPNNKDALHGLIENALADLPEDKGRRDELQNWAATLERERDPLGEYTRGRLLLLDAEEAGDVTTASRALTHAVDHLNVSATLGYGRAWFLLLQAYVNLHNVQEQAGDRVQSAQTGRTLFDKIDSLPMSVPARDPRLLAERLQQLMRQRAASGKPHPQAAFLREVVQHLQNAADERRHPTS